MKDQGPPTHLSQGGFNRLPRLRTVAEGRISIDGIAQGHHTVPGVEDQLERKAVGDVCVSSRRCRVCQRRQGDTAGH